MDNFELILVIGCILSYILGTIITSLFIKMKSVSGRFIISSNPNEDSVFKTEIDADSYDIFYTKKIVILDIVKDNASK